MPNPNHVEVCFGAGDYLKLLETSLVICNWCLRVLMVTCLGLNVPKFEGGILKLVPNAGKTLAEQLDH